MLQEANIPTLKNFDAIHPDNLRDPKYKKCSEPERSNISKQCHRQRCLRAIAAQSLTLITKIARFFSSKGWIDQSDFDHIMSKKSYYERNIRHIGSLGISPLPSETRLAGEGVMKLSHNYTPGRMNVRRNRGITLRQFNRTELSRSIVVNTITAYSDDKSCSAPFFCSISKDAMMLLKTKVFRRHLYI
ncbi:hypothetical protein BDC45DRAFT_559708 [Circinella umbellata]|nr:hypothetical protein BDC45DRAFT_559708 [Circinella umbellata]